MSGGRVVSELAQEGGWLTPGYGQMPMKPAPNGSNGSGHFWDDQTTPGTGGVTYVQGFNGGVQLNKLSGGVNSGGWVRLNTTLGVAGNFDIRVRYAIGAWSPASGSYFAMRVYDPTAALYAESLTIQRTTTPSIERITCWSTNPASLLGIYDLTPGQQEISSGIFRMTRIGTSVLAKFWLSGQAQWSGFSAIVRNTAPWRINLYVGADVATSEASGTFSDFVLAGPAT